MSSWGASECWVFGPGPARSQFRSTQLLAAPPTTFSLLARTGPAALALTGAPAPALTGAPAPALICPQEIVYERDLKYMVDGAYLAPPVGFRVLTEQDLSGARTGRDTDFTDQQVGGPAGMHT